jgi:hypothetical protein
MSRMDEALQRIKETLDTNKSSSKSGWNKK